MYVCELKSFQYIIFFPDKMDGDINKCNFLYCTLKSVNIWKVCTNIFQIINA